MHDEVSLLRLSSFKAHAWSCRIPLYPELKIGLVYFLACANGTEYMYERFLKPFLTQNQGFIDDHVAVGQAYVQNHVSSNLAWCVFSHDVSI